MKPCPRCGQPSESSPWPYLKGIDANNVTLEWRRCASCNALFSQLTPDLAVMEPDRVERENHLVDRPRNPPAAG